MTSIDGDPLPVNVWPEKVGGAEQDLSGEAAQEYIKLYRELKQKHGVKAAQTGLAWAVEELEMLE